MQDHLQACYARAFPDKQGAQVSDLVNISAGWESEIYAFDVEHGPPNQRRREGLILRIYPGGDAQAKSVREFRGMSQLHEAGYPVPRVLLLITPGVEAHTHEFVRTGQDDSKFGFGLASGDAVEIVTLVGGG